MQVFDREGTYLRTISEYGSRLGQLHCPKQLALDRLEHLYVADSHNHRISIFDQQGVFLTAFDVQDERGQFALPDPLSVCVDSEMRVFVGDTFGRMHVFAFA